MGACSSGWGDCDGSAANGCEANLQTNASSCGTCGTSCAFANAAATCSSGQCVMGACSSGWGDCDGSAANGCEANLQTNASSCGTCGTSCAFANAAATCSSGQCVMGACSSGWGDCDGSAANGCEANLQTNASSCGACGTSCAFANAAATCSSGQCVMGACSSGWGDCDGSAANGCEANLQTNASSCGTCGTSCAFANAAATCSSGQCVMGACSSGRGDCDGSAANGCEANLQTNASSCGTCGTSCAFANAAATCSGGQCVMGACSKDWGDCDGSAANGCETNLQTNTSSCSACGKACSSGANGVATCSAGACAFTCSANYGNCNRNITDGCETAHNSTFTVAASSTAFVDACSLSGFNRYLTSLTGGTQSITLPFNFTLYSVTASAAWLSVNGVLGIGSTADNASQNVCSSWPTTVRNAILALWDDLTTRATGVCTATTGSSPSRKFVVTWSDAKISGDAGSSLTFSVILSEATGAVDIVYSTMTSTASQARANGNSATIGLVDADANRPVLFSCNTAVSGGLTNKAVTFTPSCA